MQEGWKHARRKVTRELPRGTAWSDSVSVAPGKCRRLGKAMGAGRRKEGLRDDHTAPMVSTSARVRVSFPCLDHFSFRSAWLWLHFVQNMFKCPLWRDTSWPLGSMMGTAALLPHLNPCSLPWSVLALGHSLSLPCNLGFTSFTAHVPHCNISFSKLKTLPIFPILSPEPGT